MLSDVYWRTVRAQIGSRIVVRLDLLYTREMMAAHPRASFIAPAGARGALALASLLVVVTACKSKKVDDLPQDQVEDAQIEKERSRVEAGESVGEALRTPSIVVDAKDVSVNGHRAASRGDLASPLVTNGSPQVISLGDWLKGLRTHWEAIHAGKKFEAGRIAVQVPADLSFSDGAHLVQTLAYAGYADLSLVSGDASVDLSTTVAFAPTAESEGRKRIRVWGGAGGWKARPDAKVVATGSTGWGREDSSGAADPLKRSAPVAPASCAPWQDATIATLGSATSTVCGGSCTEISLSGAESFQAAVRALAAIMPAAAPRARVLLVDAEPCKP